jgi:hypothetical protein
MSDTDEPYVAPDPIVVPTASVEVVKESYQPPTASVESIKANDQPQASTEVIRLTSQQLQLPPVPVQPSQPVPSVDVEKKGIDPSKVQHG